jgi:Co/Zn/Cd efflux system component
MGCSVADPELHQHGKTIHRHQHDGCHRHLRLALRHSAPVQPDHEHASGEHDHEHGEHHDHAERGVPHRDDHSPGHGHTHGLVDSEIKRSREGIRAVALSLLVLGLAAAAQTVIFIASGSVALLADLIHNFGDALTAAPLAIAFFMRSEPAERRAGLAVVAAIFISACVAGIEAINRIIHPTRPSHVLALGVAGGIGCIGNHVAARIRTKTGAHLHSPALIADGQHAQADAYVSLAVIASAAVVAIGLPVADPIIGLAITLVILRITWQSWRTVRPLRS